MSSKTEHPRIVSREEWLVVHMRHLSREKALTRMRDQVSAERLELPWVRVAKPIEWLTPAASTAAS